jgi:hypothetical protein
MSAFRPLGLEHSVAAADHDLDRGTNPTNLKEETMKTRYYRIVGSLTALSVLAAILAAPKKWG